MKFLEFMHSIAMRCLAVLWCGLCTAVHPGEPGLRWGVLCARQYSWCVVICPSGVVLYECGRAADIDRVGPLH